MSKPGQAMNPGVISELAHLSSSLGNVMFAESGFEQLVERTIMWKIDNFFIGAVGQPQSEHTLTVLIDNAGGTPKNTSWTFHLFPKKVLTSFTHVVLECSNRFKLVRDEKEAGPDLLYFVKATIHGSRSSAAKKETKQSNVARFGETSEVFSMNDSSLLVLVPKTGGALVIELALTVIRRKPVITTSLDTADTLKKSVKTMDNPKTSFGFERFFNSKEFCDVKIYSSDGQEFHAHKIILAGNEVFDAMFKAGMTESTTGIVKLDDMSGAAVNFLLNFMYCGRILSFSMNGEKVEGAFRKAESSGEESMEASGSERTLLTADEVLYVASKYKLEQVLDFINQTFRRLCSEDNATTLFELSKIYSLDCKDFLKNYIKRHPSVLDKLLEP